MQNSSKLPLITRIQIAEFGKGLKPIGPAINQAKENQKLIKNFHANRHNRWEANVLPKKDNLDLAKNHKQTFGLSRSYSTMGNTVPNMRAKTDLIDIMIAEHYLYHDLSMKQINQTRKCGLHLNLAMGKDENGNRRHKILNGYFCDFKYCPIQQAFNAYQNFLLIYTSLRAKYIKYGWLPIFITLTIPNIKPTPSNVNKTIKRLTRSAKAMLDSPRYNGFNRNNRHNKGILKGATIKVEVTRDKHRYKYDYKHNHYLYKNNKRVKNPDYNNLHYHLHIIGSVRKSYLMYKHPKYFVNQITWLHDWQKFYGSKNIKSISVEKPYYIKHLKNGLNIPITKKVTFKNAQNKDDFNHIFEHSAKEIAKYTSKSVDFGKFPTLHKSLPKNTSELFYKVFDSKITENDLLKFEITNILLRPWNFSIKNNAFTADFRKFYKNKKSLVITNYKTHSTKRGNQISFRELLNFTCDTNDNNQFPYYFGAKNHSSNFMMKLIFRRAKSEIHNHKKEVIKNYKKSKIRKRIGNNATRKLEQKYIKKELSKSQLLALKAFHAILIGSKYQKALIFRGYDLIFKHAYQNGDLNKYKPKNPNIIYEYKINTRYSFKFKDYHDKADYLTLSEINKLIHDGCRVDPEAIRYAKIQQNKQKSALAVA